MKQMWTYWSAIVVLFMPSVELQQLDEAEEAGRNLYSARYDNLNIDTILSSNRLVTNYVDCLTNKKPCPPEGKDLKRILPEALRTKCSKCSPRQKENALKVIRKLYDDYPNHYNALREKWDPTGEYHIRFLEYLADEQYNQIGSNDFNRDQTQVNAQTVRPAAPTTTTTRRTTTVRPLTTRATRSPSFNPAAGPNSVQEVVPQASINTPSTSVFPLLTNLFGERRPSPSTPLQTVSVGNRFGEEFDSASPTPSARPQQTPQRPRPGVVTTTTTTRWPLFPNLFQQPQPNGPIAQVINHFGTKLSRTTEAIADMIHNTARLINRVVQPPPPNYVNEN